MNVMERDEKDDKSPEKTGLQQQTGGLPGQDTDGIADSFVGQSVAAVSDAKDNAAEVAAPQAISKFFAAPTQEEPFWQIGCSSTSATTSTAGMRQGSAGNNMAQEQFSTKGSSGAPLASYGIQGKHHFTAQPATSSLMSAAGSVPSAVAQGGAVQHQYPPGMAVGTSSALYAAQASHAGSTTTPRSAQQPAAITVSYQPPATTTSSYQHPAATTPSYQQTAATTPSYQHPVATTPSYQQPASTTPSYQQPASTTPSYQQPAATTPSYQQPASTTPSYQQPASTTPSYQQPAATTPSYQQSLGTQPGVTAATYMPRGIPSQQHSSPSSVGTSIYSSPAAGSTSPPTLPISPYRPAAGTSQTLQPSLSSLNNSYQPVDPHWFYSIIIEKNTVLLPFSILDSLRLEEALKTGEAVVATDGGRYDVHVAERLRKPVYWEEAHTSDVLRSTWFYKVDGDNHYVPYGEKISDRLEEEYMQAVQSQVWHKRLEFPGGESIVMHSENVIVHFKPAPQLHQLDHFEWSPVNEGQMKPHVVKRGVDEMDSIEDGEPPKIDHLILVVHGIGEFCDLKFRNLVECVDDMRALSLSLLRTHFCAAVSTEAVGRIEFLPVQWHAVLHGDATGVDW